MHAGQNNWQEQIVKDPEQDATYNSAAPGSHFAARLHPDPLINMGNTEGQ